MYTDWATLALTSNQNILKLNLDKINKYFSNQKFSSENLTDYERHTMALMALNLNPYNLNGENYIKKITDKFDGAQFGDTQKDNDDIFALIVLQNAGYTENDKIISNTINFILSKQQKDGSWDESVDLTGAGIEALFIFQDNNNVKTALENAKNYLIKNQKNDGSWGNISSTAWALEGLTSLGEKINDTTLEYFADNQDTDGGIKDTNIENRIWQTSYVLTSLSGKTWTEIMQKFKTLSLESDIIKPSFFTNSHQAQFIQKIKKFQEIKKEKINQNSIIKTESEQIQSEVRQNWFKKILKKIFHF